MTDRFTQRKFKARKNRVAAQRQSKVTAKHAKRKGHPSDSRTPIQPANRVSDDVALRLKEDEAQEVAHEQKVEDTNRQAGR